MTRAVRDGVAAGAILLGLSLSGCVSDNFPPPPSVEPNPDAGAGPTMLASAPGCGTDPGSIDLVVADGTLFWTEKMTGTVNSVPTRGGSKTVIATEQMSPGPLAVDGTSIYWVEAGRKRIMKKALGSDAGPIVFVEPGTTTGMAADENDINALLVANDTLFFGRFTSALKVPTTGGTPTPIGESPDFGRPAAFAIDATHLYQTELVHFAVSRETLDGTQDGLLGDIDMTRQYLAPDRIETSVSDLLFDAIAVVNGNVIWANYTFIESKPVGAGEHDLALTLAATSMSGKITGFVVSGDTIYLGESASNKFSVVEKVPLTLPQQQSADAGAGDAGAAAPRIAAPGIADAGVTDAGNTGAGDAGAADAGGLATPVIIATDQQSPSQFAADATNIYWRTADCKIMKLAK